MDLNNIEWNPVIACGMVLIRYLSVWVDALGERVVGINIDPRDLKTVDRLLDYLIIVCSKRNSTSCSAPSQP